MQNSIRKWQYQRYSSIRDIGKPQSLYDEADAIFVNIGIQYIIIHGMGASLHHLLEEYETCKLGIFTKAQPELDHHTILSGTKTLGTVQRSIPQAQPVIDFTSHSLTQTRRIPLHLMASTASPTFSCLIPSKKYRHVKPWRACAMASDASGEPAGTKRKSVTDTRIHWSNPDEGWIGGKSKPKTEAEKSEQPLGERFSDLINQTTTSHYQFLGVPAEADVEEIKAAYRRLSKEYHPDTTSLPLKTASEMFMQLREAYNVLSSENSRQFYDWTLAQEAESRRAERMRMRLEDPYEQDMRNWESIPDTVDRLGGKNLKLSDQAATALTIDVAIIIFSICCIIYVVLFQDSY